MGFDSRGTGPLTLIACAAIILGLCVPMYFKIVAAAESQGVVLGFWKQVAAGGMALLTGILSLVVVVAVLSLLLWVIDRAFIRRR